MSSKKLFIVLLGLLITLIAGAGALVYTGNAYLKDKTQTLIKVKTESVILAEQQQSLINAKQELKTYAELESIANTIVPKEKDQAITVRELIRFANETGINIVNISFPSSDLGNAGAIKTAPNTTSTSQLESVVALPGVYSLDINIQTQGDVPYDSLISFLRKLEQNRHTSQVKDLTISSTEDTVTFTLTIRVYIKP